MPKEGCQDRPDSYLVSITPGGKKKKYGGPGHWRQEANGRTEGRTGRKKEGGRRCCESTCRHGVGGRVGNVKAESECDRHMGRGGEGPGRGGLMGGMQVESKTLELPVSL